LAKKGIVVGTIAHDPVRDFVVGPQWWHRWSVRLGYSFVRHIFVHDDTAVDFGGKQPEGIEVHQIPHGPYEVAEPKIGRVEMRRRLGFSLDLTTEDTESTEVEAGPCLDKPSCASESGSLASGLADSPVSESLNRSAIGPASAPATSHPLLATPASPAIIFLAFGQIRDGKNLDLFLRAMTCLPENVKLLVAGKGGSGSSKPPEYYQKLAEELGVGDRCRWDIRRIPDEEVGELFNAIDFTLLTYSGKFRSMSAVLATALTAKKPVLASSGAGPLKTVVEKYRLGVFVEPDDLEEVVRGAKILLDKIAKTAASEKLSFNKISLPADWNRYEMENSWDENAKVILHQMLSS
jgi:glycosyltransferase involved in cell wall biosynthesis